MKGYLIGVKGPVCFTDYMNLVFSTLSLVGRIINGDARPEFAARENEAAQARRGWHRGKSDTIDDKACLINICLFDKYMPVGREYVFNYSCYYILRSILYYPWVCILDFSGQCVAVQLETNVEEGEGGLKCESIIVEWSSPN